MITKIKEGSENYTATVVAIKDVFDIENADRIKRAVIFGNNVIISSDVKVGDLMIYFNSGTKLSDEYCKFNNLYEDSSKNLDTTKKGYVNSKNRVRAVKLRGIISDGFLMPISSLEFLPTSSFDSNAGSMEMQYNVLLDGNFLNEGDSFNYIGDTLICEKYIVPVRNGNPGGKAPKQPTKISRLVENQFYLHGDTDNLRRNMHKINPNDVIGIHYKKHGCSAVIGNVLVKKNLTWYEKLLKRFGVNVVDTEYDIVYSSRKVVKNGYLNPNTGSGFYGEDIWKVVADEIGHLIPKNWTLYGEILGFTPSGGFIQPKYDYGCSPESLDEQYKNSHTVYQEKPQHKFYVYKISVVNPDGRVIYLTDRQIQEWCDKVGLLYSDTFIYYGTVLEHYNVLGETYKYYDGTYSPEWRERYLDMLEKSYNEKDCYMCTTKVPEEGIILRIERLESYEAYKLKAKRFLLMESEQQESDVVNLEDNQ